MIKMIFCCDEDNGIGKENRIPWHSKEDFSYFKSYTIDQTIVMGYNTWISLNKKPLPRRQNIVLSSREIPINERTEGFDYYTFDTFPVLEDFIVIGGKQMYDLYYLLVDEISISTIKGNYNCDVKLDVERYIESFYIHDEYTLSPIVNAKIYRKRKQ